MKKKNIVGLITLLVIAVAVMFAGCVEKEGITPSILTSTPLTPSSTPEKTSTESPVEIPPITTKIPLVDEGWWTLKWSNGGKTLKVDYANKGGSGSSYTFVKRKLDGSAKVLEKRSRTISKDTDSYGREFNTNVTNYYKGFGGKAELTTSVTNSTVTHSAGFSRRSTLEINYERDENGILNGCSGSEVFSGSLPGGITYLGSSTAIFTAYPYGLVWTERVEEASYYKDSKLYAKTVTITIPESKEILGRLRLVRETEWMTTTYADGSQRESEILILHDIDSAGNDWMSGSGTVIGTEIFNRASVNYTGSITIAYRGPGSGWQKLSYEEKRSAAVNLPERLPFEVIFSNDLSLREGFY